MTKKVCFHLDESVSNAIADGLRRRGIEVTTTPESGLISAPDEEQLAFAVAHGKVLVTHDDDFVALHQEGKFHHGIAYCGPNRRSLGDLIRMLTLIYDVLTPEEMTNHIEFL